MFALHNRTPDIKGAFRVFDWYAFADYSGSLRTSEQRRRIAFSLIKDHDPIQTSFGRTRYELMHEVMELLEAATRSGKRMIFGFDHNYSFPERFYEALTGRKWSHWRELLTLLGAGNDGIPGLELEEPRKWAAKANNRLTSKLRTVESGPFWGPHFKPLKKPAFPYGGQIPERRLVEEKCKRMKSIFQLGGAGAVGLQSLLGMVYLNKLIRFCRELNIPLHVWPFDGLSIPDNGHVLVEMYPTVFNEKNRSDLADAQSCVNWLLEEDRNQTLKRWFSPGLTEIELERIRLEGWCLGI